jgi:hypothetical protein
MLLSQGSRLRYRFAVKIKRISDLCTTTSNAVAAPLVACRRRRIRRTLELALAAAMVSVALGIAIVIIKRSQPPKNIYKISGPWLIVELGRVDNIVARLRVLRRASMDKEKWIAIEFQNEGNLAAMLGDVHYSIDRTAGGGYSGGMASGTNRDLFPEEWAKMPAGRVYLNPGTTSAFEQPSNYSSALLKIPSKNGWSIKATVSISFEVKAHGHYSTPKTIPFEFEWAYPTPDGIKHMRDRLKSLVSRPIINVDEAYCLNTMLETPELDGTLDAHELLAALTMHNGAFSGRNYILNYLNKKYSRSTEVIEHYQRLLEKHDGGAVDDIWHSPNIWSPPFAELLFQIYEHPTVAKSSPTDTEKIVDILARRNRGIPADQAIARRLSAGLLKISSVFEKKPSDLPLPQRQDWANSALLLGKTRDVRMIPRLRPFLDDRTMVWDEANIDKIAITFSLPLTRACDVAMEAILTILDGSPRKAGIDVPRIAVSGIPNSRDLAAQLIFVKKERDTAIAALKERIAALPSTEQPTK